MLTRLGQCVRSGAAFSLAIALMGVVVALFSATQLGFGSKEEVGPGTFPFIVGFVLAVAGFRSGITSLRRENNLEGSQAQQAPQVRRVIYTVLAYLAWLLFTPLLGYIPASFAVTMAMAKTAGLEGWPRPIVLSLSVTIFLYLLFEVLFYVDLPRGLLD